MSGSGDRSSGLRRRRVLASVGAAGSLVLAGCTGGGDESDPESEASNGDQPTDGSEQAEATCPEWTALERVDLAEHGIADFPVVPSYPTGWEETNAFVEPDEAIFAVADPDLIGELGQAYDYVSIQVELIDADGAVPPWDDWPTKDWSEVEDETDPIEFEGRERPAGLVEREREAIWRFSAAGPNDTHMLVSVIVRVSEAACLANVLPLGREVLDTLELNSESNI